MQIDILVVNCSLFNPTPSLSAMIVNHFKMRSNIVSYNLGGMGCSAGVIAVGLAKEQLQVCHLSTAFTFLSAALHCCLRSTNLIPGHRLRFKMETTKQHGLI